METSATKTARNIYITWNIMTIYVCPPELTAEPVMMCVMP